MILLLLEKKSDPMSLNKYIGMALGMAAMVEVTNEQWKDEILEKWEESKNFPRKKKKKVRKRLLLEWSAASWSPFKDL